MKKIDLDSEELRETKEIFRKFRENGFECYIVGGAVRDHLLGEPINDIDFTTNATPEEVMSIFDHTNPIGIKFGTVQVIENGKAYEITTFREEADYKDNRHPSELKFSKNLIDDIKRRDFTINALAINENGEVIDFNDGLKDLKEGIIRTVGDPTERFSEDSLRKWRAIRIAAQKSFEIDLELHRSIIFDPDTSMISYERIREELSKILLSKKVNWGGYLLIRTRLYPMFLRRISPETIKRVEHTEDLVEPFEIIYTLEDYLPTRLTALLLPFTYEEAEHFLKTLGYSKKITKEVLNYKKYLNTTISDGVIEYKKMAAELGRDNLLKLCDLQESIANFENDRIKRDLLKKTKDLALKIINNNEPLVRSDLKINGNDLLKLGYKDIDLKKIFEILLEKVYLDPESNTTDALIKILKTDEVKNAINFS